MFSSLPRECKIERVIHLEVGKKSIQIEHIADRTSYHDVNDICNLIAGEDGFQIRGGQNDPEE
jgi:hypothetical protein